MQSFVENVQFVHGEIYDYIKVEDKLVNFLSSSWMKFYKQNKNICSKPIFFEKSQINSTMNTIINGKTFILDEEDRTKYLLSKKNFTFVSASDTYPCYLTSNQQKISLIDFVFNPDQDRTILKFSNGDVSDLRRCNIEKYHFFHDTVLENHEVLEYIPGHAKTMGKDAHKMKNPMWRIKEDDKEYLLMYCEVDTLCKLCPEGYQKIVEYETEHYGGRKLTWTYHKDAYVGNTEIKLHMHQVIMSCHGQGRGTSNTSVDHIDRNKLNNTLENLRIATQEEQMENTTGVIPGTKRARQCTAKPLPEGFTQDMMRRTVTWNQEPYGNETPRKTREFFRVEDSSKNFAWASSKSSKVSLMDKLLAANKVADDYQKGIMPEKTPKLLPDYFRISEKTSKLVFEFRKSETNRLNLTMALPEEYDLEEQFVKFLAKLKKKYPEENFADAESFEF